jgi:hypothetical protein
MSRKHQIKIGGELNAKKRNGEECWGSFELLRLFMERVQGGT